MTTIKHVAALAGVSFTTVSHVLNGTRPVSDGARQRVEDAVRQLGYSPSAVARALKLSETRMLGVLVPNITNPFFGELARGIEDCCLGAGYSVFLCSSDDDPERQERYMQILLERRIDGLLLAAPIGDADAIGDRLQAARVPSVVVERAIDSQTANRVRLDHTGGAKQAVEHLLQLGHRRIACLSGPSQFAVTRARVAGWREALAAEGHASPDDWLFEGEFSAASGHALALDVLAQGGFTAIFASNDLMAIGALRAAAERGVVVPQDLSVIGFDGIELGEYVHPALSTVGYPIRNMGEEAATILIDAISHAESPARDITFPTQLMLRASTAAAPR